MFFFLENPGVMFECWTCSLRFLVLCICSRWSGLSVGALDTLGNIATEIALPEPKTDVTCLHLLSTVCKGISSQDRAFVLRCLEVLNKLAANDNNEEILNGFIEQEVCASFVFHLFFFIELSGGYIAGTPSMNCCFFTKSFYYLLTIIRRLFKFDMF